MNIPNFSQEKFVDGNGHLTPTWRFILSQLIQQFQTHVSDEGYILPSQTQADITSIQDGQKPGGLIYDNEGEFAKVNTNGVYKNVSTYEELSTADITAIESGKRNSRMIRDTDTGDLMMGLNDEFKTVTLT